MVRIDLPEQQLNAATTTAPNMAEALFSDNLISPEVQAALPEGYIIRALRRNDFDTGFLECLRVLTTVGDVTEEGFGKQFDAMLTQGGYYIAVIEDPSRTENPVVATGALIVERKLYVSNAFWSSLGHITKH